MAKKTWRTILFLGAIFSFFLGHPLGRGFVLAFEVHYPTIDILGQTFSINDTSSLGEYICYFFGLGTNLAVFISVIIIAFGGILYLVSYGRGKFTSDAVDWIKGGILGLLIVISASLIAYTINPNLTDCKVGILSLINIGYSNTYPTTEPSAPWSTYQEIPIGKLTENLLTRTMDCYGFDPEGNPVAGERITTEDCGFFGGCPEGQTCDKKTSKCYISGPTYLNHDRADCLIELIDGAQKKGQMIAGLSDKITGLMNTCSCRIKDAQGNDTSESKCDPVCDPLNGGCGLFSTGNPAGINQDCTGSCKGDCIGGACKQPPNTTDCCPPGVKNQIEHGAISLSVDVGSVNGDSGSCTTPKKDYKGLDEFRCPNPNDGDIKTPCSGIPGWVEEKIQVDNKTIITINQKKWELLNSIQQLTYFREKTEELKQRIQADKNELDKAKSALNNCYMAVPYVDLVKTYQTTNQKVRLISITKTFSDPETNAPIDASKYCAGFNYNNSSCLKKCNDLCPDTSNQAIGFYRQETGSCAKNDTACLNKAIEKAYQERPCPYAPSSSDTKTFAGCITACEGDQTNSCGKKYLSCSNEYNFCEDQSTNNSQCVIDNSDVCLFGGQSFQNCANQTTDQGNTNFCIDNAYKCKNGSNEYAGYIDCIKPNATSTTTDPLTKALKTLGFGQDDIDVLSQILNPVNVLDLTKNLNVLSIILRKAGVPQNDIDALKGGSISPALTKGLKSLGLTQGDIDTLSQNLNPVNVLDPTKNLTNVLTNILRATGVPQNDIDALIGGANPVNILNRILGITGSANIDCSQDYSASFLFEHPECQKCTSPYISLPNGGGKCQDVYPETAKCPTSSNCPACPCDQIDATLKSYVPVESSQKVAGEDIYYTTEQPILAHQIVGPQCNKYSRNDDPLTFYCQNNWWLDPNREISGTTPIGTEKVCPKTREIPVGQTVDNAENWAVGLINSANKMQNDIQDIIGEMYIIGRAKDPENPIKDYCKCNAKYVSEEPICETDCQYWQVIVPPDTFCGCGLVKCKGSPCDQITDYLAQLWDYYRKFKLDFTSFYINALKEPRSDIMKELTYSRQTTSSCSLISNNSDSQNRLLSCTRVEDELISPITTGKITINGETANSYCYGKEVGKLFSVDPSSSQYLSQQNQPPSIDNWFCCQEYQKTSGAQGAAAQ